MALGESSSLTVGGAGCVAIEKLDKNIVSPETSHDSSTTTLKGLLVVAEPSGEFPKAITQSLVTWFGLVDVPWTSTAATTEV
jgi:hypothetical protein